MNSASYLSKTTCSDDINVACHWLQTIFAASRPTVNPIQQHCFTAGCNLNTETESASKCSLNKPYILLQNWLLAFSLLHQSDKLVT